MSDSNWLAISDEGRRRSSMHSSAERDLDIHMMRAGGDLDVSGNRFTRRSGRRRSP